MGKVFKLDDKVRTFYGEANVTYREQLKAGNAIIEIHQGETIFDKPQYGYRETGSRIWHPVDGRQASAFLKQQKRELDKKRGY